MKKAKSSATLIGVRPKADRSGELTEVTDGIVGGKRLDYRKHQRSGSGVTSGTNGVIKWFKHITDAAESYKSKDAAKNKKPSQQLTLDTSHSSSSSIITAFEETSTPTSDRPIKFIESSSQEQENGVDVYGEVSRGKRRGSQQQPDQRQLERAEILQFEMPQLVQPNEVTVSLTEVIDRLETASTPLDQIKEKNCLIETAMMEKKSLVANILQIPFEDYDHISEVVDEVRNCNDIKELLLSSVTQADLLTRMINESLDAKFVEGQSMALTDLGGTGLSEQSSTSDRSQDDLSMSSSRSPIPDAGRRVSMVNDIPVTVSYSQLTKIADRLHYNLTQLLELISKTEMEEEKLMTSVSEYDPTSPLPSQSINYASPKTTTVPSISYVTEEVEPVVLQPDTCVTSSFVTMPVTVQQLEVIEPKIIVTSASTLTRSTKSISKRSTGNHRDMSQTKSPSTQIDTLSKL